MTSPPDELRDNAAALHALVSSSPDHFYLYDRAGRHLYVNPAAAQALDLEPAAFIGQTWQTLGFSPEVTERFDIEREKVFASGVPWRGEMIFPTLWEKKHSLHDYIVSPVYADDGSVEAVLVTARDITTHEQDETDFQYRALHDELTGLANRTLLNDRLMQSLHAARRTKRPVALLFIDINHFKQVNDAAGHHAGDLVLQELALRWTGVLRASDTLCRLGGDEFVVLLLSTERTGANETAARLHAEIAKVFEVEGRCFHLSASIGIAIRAGATRNSGQDASHAAEGDALLRQADEAMYRLKHQTQERERPTER